MAKKTGLVAFFDILGYQNFISANDPEIAADKIAEFIKKLKAFQSETFLKLFGKETQPVLKTFVEKLVYLVISDSILLTFETDMRDMKSYQMSQFFFLLYCVRLFKELFIYGLPLRGAIEYGEYVLVENQMFAGRPIVHAYQAATDLDLSACKVSGSVGELLETGKDNIHLNYNTPLKNGEEEPLVLLIPFGLEDDEKDENTLGKIPDLKQFVMESFCAHNKMINREVQKKILNTEIFLRYCKTRWK